MTVVSESEHHPTQLKNQLLATKAVQVQKLATIQALILEKKHFNCTAKILIQAIVMPNDRKLYLEGDSAESVSATRKFSFKHS